MKTMGIGEIVTRSIENMPKEAKAFSFRLRLNSDLDVVGNNENTCYKVMFSVVRK